MIVVHKMGRNVTKKITFRTLCLMVTLVLTVSGSAFGDKSGENKEFITSNYPGSNFNTSQTLYHHGSVVITIIQVKNKRKAEPAPNSKNDWYCRAWLKIEKDGKQLHQEYLDIDPVGAPYGIFVPNQQPNPKYFLFEKIGDYRSILYLVDKDGGLQTLHGGQYFWTDDSRYLFSENGEAEDGITDVFDMELGKLVFSKQIKNYDAYQKGKLYFYSKIGLTADGRDEVEKKDTIFLFDFNKNTFVQKKVDSSFWDGAKKISYDFDPSMKDDCNCGLK